LWEKQLPLPVNLRLGGMLAVQNKMRNGWSLGVIGNEVLQRFCEFSA
jgi:hypothetical protein